MVSNLDKELLQMKFTNGQNGQKISDLYLENDLQKFCREIFSFESNFVIFFIIHLFSCELSAGNCFGSSRQNSNLKDLFGLQYN